MSLKKSRGKTSISNAMPCRRASLSLVALLALALGSVVAPDVAAAPPGATRPAPPTRTADDRNVDWLRHVYQDVLGRPIDSQGLASFRGVLAQGATRTQVATVILGSTEFRHRVVGELYAELLGRPADSQSAGVWMTALATGTTIDSLVASIVGSQEYFARAGGTNDAFVATVYKDLLHRPADPPGKTSFAAWIAAGHTRVQIAQTVLASDEHRNALITAYYTRFLRRPVNAGGRATFVAMLGQGARRETVIAMILASDEYYARS